MSINNKNIDKKKKIIEHNLKIRKTKANRKRKLQVALIIIMTLTALYLFDIL